MRTHPTSERILRVLSSLLFFSLLAIAPACEDKGVDPLSEVELQPFKEIASTAMCAEFENRLFLVDYRLVFWHREGDCADASYGYTLFGRTPDRILCQIHDSFMGKITIYNDERYRAMFDTMVANLDSLDLGVGSTHTVLSIPF